ncbi:MAG: hypothetical protein J6D20_03920 [Clostridia bacterium]|nr:hypothetical protein [Clostridia bacterium]
MKKLTSLILAIGLMLTFALSVNAQEPAITSTKASYDSSKAAAWNNYTYSDKEIDDMIDAFSTNKLSNALNASRMVSDDETTIKLNDTYYVTITCEEYTSQKNTRGTAYWVMKRYHAEGKNVFGMTIWDFYVDADFIYDGISVEYIGATSYGYTYALGWSCSNFDAAGYNISTTNAKAYGSGLYEFKIGIDPIAMTVQSFTNMGYLYCTNNG